MRKVKVSKYDMLDNPLLDTDAAIPNTSQMKELLSLFQNANVYALVEPIADHPKNYKLAKKLMP